MKRHVIDASIALAVLSGQADLSKMELFLRDGYLSAINAAEVQAHLVRWGMGPGQAWRSVRDLPLEIHPFDLFQARTAGDLIALAQPQRLSLGDRACLSLGKFLNTPVVTLDREWQKLDLGIAIYVPR
jgi:ribonuclease VapC